MARRNERCFLASCWRVAMTLTGIVKTCPSAAARAPRRSSVLRAVGEIVSRRAALRPPRSERGRLDARSRHGGERELLLVRRADERVEVEVGAVSRRNGAAGQHRLRAST